MTVLNPNIWVITVITPKNEGFGFPWIFLVAMYLFYSRVATISFVDFFVGASMESTSSTHNMRVSNSLLLMIHGTGIFTKCRQIYHAWMVWVLMIYVTCKHLGIKIYVLYHSPYVSMNARFRNYFFGCWMVQTIRLDITTL